MTVSETLAKLKTDKDIEPKADYTGVERADDFIFAIQTSTEQNKVGDWIVCAERVKEHSGALNATTEDNSYIRAGTVTEKGEVQRTFALNGNRCVGDAAQDFLLSHKVKFGSGQSVIFPYVYFSVKTGKGEKGQASFIVTSDTSGAAGAAARLCLRRKGHWHPVGVRLPERPRHADAGSARQGGQGLISAFPFRSRNGIFYAVKQVSPGQYRGTAQRKEPENVYLWTGI